MHNGEGSQQRSNCGPTGNVRACLPLTAETGHHRKYAGRNFHVGNGRSQVRSRLTPTPYTLRPILRSGPATVLAAGSRRMLARTSAACRTELAVSTFLGHTSDEADCPQRRVTGHRLRNELGRHPAKTRHISVGCKADVAPGNDRIEGSDSGYGGSTISGLFWIANPLTDIRSIHEHGA